MRFMGPVPGPDNEAGLKEFSARDEARTVPARHEGTLANGLAHRLAQGAEPEPRRAGHCFHDKNFGTVKVSPVFYWSDADMEAYLTQHNLPNEWDYFDPAKADEKRECGLHADWGGAPVQP